ncbi:MAG: hypothetical protein V4635_08865 [Bacteroidota bacterium]
MTPQNKIYFEFNCKQKSGAMRQLNGQSFCSTCQTVVYDLTTKTREEIAGQIKQNGGQLCGRFFMDQISEEEPVERPLGLKVVLMSITAFLTFSAPKIQAQAPTVNTEQTDNTKSLSKNDEEEHTVHDTSSCRVAVEPARPFWTNGRNGVKRKEYMRIGRRHFYIINKFPFFRTRTAHRGKMAYRGF